MRHAIPKWWLVIPVLLLTTWLGARGLNIDAFWMDEQVALYRAGGAHYGGPLPVGEIISRVRESPFQLPSYYLLLAGWGRIFELTEYGGRMLSLMLGLLTVAWVYRMGIRLLSPQTGLGAAVVLGSSAFFVDYLHEMRPYALYALFTVISVSAYWTLVTDHQQSKWQTRLTQALFVGSMIGLLYVHHFAALVVAALGLYHLIFVPRDRAWWRLIILFGITGSAYLPWVANTINALSAADAAGGRKAGAMSINVTVDTLVTAFSNGQALMFVFVLGYGLVALRSQQLRERRAVTFVTFLAVTVLVAAMIVNEGFAVLTHIRYVISLWLLLAILIGFGIHKLAAHRQYWVFILGIWIVPGVIHSVEPEFIRSIHGNFPHLPFRELAAEIEAHAQSNDVIALHVPDFNWMREPTFDHYMHGLPGQSTLLEAIPGLPDGTFYEQSKLYLGDSERVWLAVDKTLPPTFRLSDFERALNDDYVHCDTVFDLSDMRLDVYARSTEAPTAHFGDGIGVTLFDEFPETINNEQLDVIMGWQLSDTVPRDMFSFALHVTNANGTLLSQVDRGLPTNSFSCLSVPVDFNDFSSGNYTLSMIVYNWQNGERLPVTGGVNGVTGERLRVAQFRLP